MFLASVRCRVSSLCTCSQVSPSLSLLENSPHHAGYSSMFIDFMPPQAISTIAAAIMKLSVFNSESSCHQISSQRAFVRLWYSSSPALLAAYLVETLTCTVAASAANTLGFSFV